MISSNRWKGIIHRKYALLFLLSILLISGTVYALFSTSFNITGRYVTTELIVSPATYDLGNVATFDDMYTNTIIYNPSIFNANITWVSSSPSWIVMSVVDWNNAEYRTLLAGENVTVVVRIQIGLPEPDVDQDIPESSIQFYGWRVQ